MRQILINLIGNAIKFTSEGHVSLSVRSENLGAGKYLLKFEVQDSGIGIKYEQQQQLFRPFSQADTSTTRPYGGAGLGLVLAKGLSQAMGGELNLIASTPGIGTAFLASVLVKDAQPDAKLDPNDHLNLVAKQDIKPIKPLEGIRILLAEDSPDNQLLIQRYLIKEGVTLEIVSDGAEAVARAGMSDFDLILMDVQMPTMDGYSAAGVLLII